MSSKGKRNQEQILEIATPGGNPPAGSRFFYLKVDGFLYTKDSAGVETKVQEGEFLQLAGGDMSGTLIFNDGIGVENKTSDLKILFTDLFGSKILRIGNGVDEGLFYNASANSVGLQFAGIDQFSVQAAGAIMGADASGSSKISFYGATPIVRGAAIGKPAGGGTVDAEARTAIDSLIDLLSDAAGGLGLTA